jgi:UDP-N-acetylmuramate--alanine ligase
MVAVAGTHGKTTTTSMIIWACKELKIPAAYLVGTTLGFAESGKYEKGDKFFIYEADEYDRETIKNIAEQISVMLNQSNLKHQGTYGTTEDESRGGL